MSNGHALLSPSGAERWRCHGALAACRNEPNPPNEFSASGTLTHSIAQAMLAAGERGVLAPPQYCVGNAHTVDGFKFTVDQDRLDRALIYVKAVQRDIDIVGVERWLDTSGVVGVPGQGGTADAITGNALTNQLSIHDLKDGANLVYAAGNRQLLIYGAAALQTYSFLRDWETLKVVIHQPRMHHYDEHVYTRDEVEREMVEVRHDAMESYRLYTTGTAAEIEAAMTPGESQCKYCPIRGKCPARTKAVLDLFPVTDNVDPMIEFLNDAEVAAALARADEIENWCRDIRSEATNRVLSGKTLPGYKLVQGKKGARYWTNQEEALKMLPLMLDPEQCYKPRELITPTAAEKLLKGTYSAIADLVGQPSGSLSIARADDKRPAVTVSAAEFEVLK